MKRKYKQIKLTWENFLQVKDNGNPIFIWLFQGIHGEKDILVVVWSKNPCKTQLVHKNITHPKDYTSEKGHK